MPCAPPGWRMSNSSRRTNTRWSTPIGCTPPANPRFCVTAIMMCSPPIPWNSGPPRPSNPASATPTSTDAAPPTTRARRTPTSRREWVRKHTPKGIQTEVRVLSAGPGLVVNPDHPAIRVAARAFGDVFGKPTVFVRSGGSIPIVGDFATHLGIPTILMGFGLPDDGLHSPNEKYKIENYYMGITTVAHFLEQYAAGD